MKGRALILWRSEDRTRGNAIKVEVTGSTLDDTLDNLKAAMLEKMDAAPDEQVFGWYTASISIDRNH